MNEQDRKLESLRRELDKWRERIDGARVQAKLGSMEARDKLGELEKRLTPVLRDAKRGLEEIVETGTDEARTLGKSLLAGWDELRRTHRELSSEAERERDAPRKHPER